MTPRSPPFGHPNPYQSIPSPAVFTTILSTLHKHMALHGRIASTIIINSASTTHSTVTSRCYGPTDRRPSNITHFIQPLTRFIYAFKRILFESKYIFLYNTHHFMVFTIDELSVDICPSMSHTSFGL